MIRSLLYFYFIISFISCVTDQENESLFDSVHSNFTGITFTNTLNDTPDFNIMEYLYYYNGGGVAAGDINNDGLVDLFFTGNQVDDALYVNQGNLKFKDISKQSGINDYNGWSTGVTMVDINADGWLDIYVCRLGNYKSYDDHNRLYINQKDGSFKEASIEYGLAFSGFGTQAIFFDYDRDGDLDCYLLNHSVKRPDQFVNAGSIRNEQDSLAGDRLYRNEGTFVDVTLESGILSSNVGFGLGIAVGDLNNDGWPDIYVGNDFHENDYLYLNNQNGGFINVTDKALNHTSNFSMGTTMADVNSDGRLDILSLDMQPEEEVIYKQSGGWESKEIYDFKRSYGYHHQSPRNALQINLGNDEGIPKFSEQACAFDLHNTDWSWSPLITDFDLDGDKDIFITNGIHRRPNDMDFVNYLSNNPSATKNNKDLISKMGKGDVHNYFFLNNKNKFERNSIGSPSISNGACYADLDNDGDWDIVTNNINNEASVLINNTNPEKYLKLSFRDTSQNVNAIGVSLKMTSQQDSLNYCFDHISSSSGFQSMNEQKIILPWTSEYSTLDILWPDGSKSRELLENTTGNLTLSKLDNNEILNRSIVNETLKSNSTDLVHHDVLFNDQNSDPLLPYSRATNSLEICQSDKFIYMTQGRGKNGSLISKETNEKIELDRGVHKTVVDETCAVFFDADGDGDEDIFVGHGGLEKVDGDPSLIDRLYINDNGDFNFKNGALPNIAFNTSSVCASDYDLDGDVDLFIGSNGVAGSYGVGVSPYLLINNGSAGFSALNLGINEMIYDATWSDLDGDGREDLVIAGHWMPLTILYNKKDGFHKKEVKGSSGFWFDLFIHDVDGDGDKDILAGNFGTNHRIKASDDYPLKLYVDDFDDNGQSDPIFSYYVSDKEYPYVNLDLLLKQLPAKKKQFRKVKDFADKEIDDIFSKEELSKATIKSIEHLESSLFLNNDNDWEMQKLPEALQLAPILAIEQWQDGFVFGGNLYDVDPNWGRQDALPLTFGIYDNNMWTIRNEQMPIVLSEMRSLLNVNGALWIGNYNDSTLVIEQ